MRGLTVLLVEDRRLLRWWMTRSLQRAGCFVLTADSPSEAMSMVTAYPFDVLVTDWRLADGHDGSDVLAQIRERYPEMPAILISAEADTKLSGRAEAAGFDLVIEKPFSATEIVDAVRKLAVIRPLEVAS